ncbi:MAG TPA: phosphoenolpyruvate synthase, partial [Sporichthya sp.]|nr:phosphoenolpyruvate synthase [Sporichthya sp.]
RRVEHGAVGVRGHREAVGHADAPGRQGPVHLSQRCVLAAHQRDVTRADLAERAAHARHIVYNAGLPDDVAEEIRAGHRRLRHEFGEDLALAVRSSATAEDLPTASFAGQHESYLNVRTEDDLLEACRRCFASLFTDRAVHYRVDQGFDQFAVSLSIGIMRMVRSDLGSAGVMFTLDPDTGFRDVVLVTGAYGLGENIVQGTIEPDEFWVHKPTFDAGHRVVLRRRLGTKRLTMIRTDDDGADRVRNVDTPDELRRRFCLSDAEVLELAGYARTIEGHYGRGMDIEWAKDGIDGRLYIVQARPETAMAQRSALTLQTFRVGSHGDLIVTGHAVGERVATGVARRIDSVAELSSFRAGEVLVADTTTPDWEPVLKTAAAVVTNRGGRTCHAAIVARELGIPAVVGAEDATERILPGAAVTVSCAEGEVGHVYTGIAEVSVETVDLAGMPRPRTAIMVNVGNPDIAFATAMLPTDGVGLARMEFIIAEAVKAHPMALLHPDRIRDRAVRAAVTALTDGYSDGGEYFVEKLSEGVGTIAAAFYPKPVVVRMSDFKTNEYAGLLGGADFEPDEENPMLGFRGASRYAHPAYEEGFALECRAMRRVREDMGLDNVILMLPFVRRVAEADQVLERMADLGLRRGENGLKVYAMCEIPNNVISIDEFAKRFDGMSIGSNDLTQLTLGVDRDSALVAFDYDERDPGVKAMIRLAVEGCRRAGIHSGICGQAPSDHPDMAAFLVEIGIDSMSLNPDSVLRTTRSVLDMEERVATGLPEQRVDAPSLRTLPTKLGA